MKKSLNLILKIAGKACNLNCSYCFEKKKLVSNDIMSEETLEEIILNIPEYNMLNITFHGGEPLIVGKEHMKKLLNIVRNHYNRINSIKIQTNGTLLDEEYAKIFFEEYRDLNIEIAISLDGNQLMNSHRKNYNGEESFKEVINAYSILKKWNKKAGMLSVITKDSYYCHEEYLELIESIDNISFVKINPLFNVENNNLTQESLSPMQFTEFLINLSKKYIEKKIYKHLAIEPLLSIIQKINNKNSKYCNYSFEKCLNFITFYPDGLIGICDCFSAKEFSLKIEDFQNNFNDFFIRENFNKIKELQKDCLKCSIFDFCTGGCLSQRYYFSDNKILLEEFCNSKMKLFEFAKNFKIQYL